MRHIKIVCTIGPSCQETETIKKLVREGMNIARLNFSHGTYSEHLDKIRIIRSIEKELGGCISILQDLAGPKIRLGEIPGGNMEIKTGENINLTSNPEISNKNLVFVNYPHLIDDLSIGDTILLADGSIELKVKEKQKDKIRCHVEVGGILASHKGISFPQSKLSVETFTSKDQDDLTFGLEQGVDLVALSFVKDASDIRRVHKFINQHGKELPVIAKIERKEAITCLDEIVKEADGIMVARGDLGIEVKLESIPILQKVIIKKANEAGKPVITATQMLRSMVKNPRPTRAEVCDVANAIFDGTDCIMLSEETAIGQYPVESVGFMAKIAEETERKLAYWEWLVKERQSLTWETVPTEDAVSHSASVLAREIEAVAIVASTASGMTARLVSRFRPKCPIIALTPSEATYRSLSISWGVIPVMVPLIESTDALFNLAREIVTREGLGKGGDRIVITAGVPIGIRGNTNLLRAMKI